MTTKLETKIAVIGAGGVGKSAFTVQYIQNTFVAVYDPTIEDSYRKQITVDGVICHFDVLDTAGQEEFKSLRDQYMRNCEGFINLYAITDRKTFQEVDEFHEQLTRVKESEFPYALVGNKCDLETERQVSTQEGKALAQQYKCHFFEASAKQRINVDEPFEALLREMIQKLNAASGGGEKKKEKKGGCLVL